MTTEAPPARPRHLTRMRDVLALWSRELVELGQKYGEETREPMVLHVLVPGSKWVQQHAAWTPQHALWFPKSRVPEWLDTLKWALPSIRAEMQKRLMEALDKRATETEVVAMLTCDTDVLPLVTTFSLADYQRAPKLKGPCDTCHGRFILVPWDAEDTRKSVLCMRNGCNSLFCGEACKLEHLRRCHSHEETLPGAVKRDDKRIRYKQRKKLEKSLEYTEGKIEEGKAKLRELWMYPHTRGPLNRVDPEEYIELTRMAQKAPVDAEDILVHAKVTTRHYPGGVHKDVLMAHNQCIALRDDVHMLRQRARQYRYELWKLRDVRLAEFFESV